MSKSNDQRSLLSPTLWFPPFWIPILGVICIQLVAIFVSKANLPIILSAGAAFYIFCQAVLSPAFAFLLLPLANIGIDPYAVKSSYVGLIGFSASVLDFVIFLSVIAIAIRYLATRRLNPVPLPQQFVVGAFLVNVSVAFLIGVLQGLPPREVMADSRALVYYSTFFLAVFSIHTRRQIVQLSLVIMAAGIIGAAWNIVRTMVGIASAASIFGFGRLVSPNESVHGMVAVFSVVMLSACDTLGKRILASAAILVPLAAMLMSLARGTWLGFVFTLLFASVLVGARFGKKRILALYAGVGWGGLLILGCFVAYRGPVAVFRLLLRIFSLLSLKLDPSALARVHEWNLAGDIFQKYPIFGTGLGYLYNVYWPDRGFVVVPYIHNSYLFILTKMGLLGLAVFAVMVFYIIYIGVRQVRRVNDAYVAAVLIGLVSMMCLLVVKCVTTYHFAEVTLTPLIGAIMGAIAAVVNWDRSLTHGS